MAQTFRALLTQGRLEFGAQALAYNFQSQHLRYERALSKLLCQELELPGGCGEIVPAQKQGSRRTDTLEAVKVQKATLC